MFRVLKTKADREGIATSEHSSSSFIPYKCHWDSNTIITKDNQLLKVVKLSGFSFETADDEDIDVRKTIRNQLFKGMALGNLGIYFHIIRSKQQAYSDDYASIDMPDGFACYLDQKWCQKHRNKLTFANELYITIVKKAGSVGGVIGSLEEIFQKVLQSADKEAWNHAMLEAYEELEEGASRVMNTLRQYHPEILGIVETPEGTRCKIIEFLSKVVNCGQSSKMLLGKSPLDKVINTQRLYFGNKAIEIKCQDGTSKFAGMVSLKEYGPKSWAGITDSFLQMPFEFILTQSFEFINKQVAIGAMQLQQNRMIQSDDKAVSQIYEINEALDRAMSGEIHFGKHHLSVMCIADNIMYLENILSMASVELTNTGGVGIRERVNMEPAFWGQLPANFDYIVRKSTINTLNLSGFNSFHNYPTGIQHGNHWGDAVTVLDTTSGTPYYFNFHVRDIGHTTIIGPTGAGKTVLMNFLCAQSQKFKCRLFFFDKDRGAEIF